MYLIIIMYRSQEILQIFSKIYLSQNIIIYLPQDIIKYILHYERDILYEKSIYQWIKTSEIFHKFQKQKFFYEDIKNTFLKEIQDINGNFDYLKKYKSKIFKIKKENQICMLYLNSVRY